MNIVVLCGGTSTEREVSLNSGSMVCDALRSIGHNAVLLDVFFGNENKNLLDVSDFDVQAEKEKLQKLSKDVDKVKKERKGFFGENVFEICQQADIVFMALHGANGEDGKCQAAFDLQGIKYTAEGSVASALAMDKSITKQIFMAQNVSTPKGIWIKKGESTNLSDYGMKIPVVVKASNGGSSVGVVIVKDEKDYDAALKECFALEDTIVIEEFVEGREFSVGVVDGKALPIVEIIPKTGWYDYKNKYLPGATEDVCPAQINEELTKKMQKLAEEACKALGIVTYSRADVLMKKDGSMYCIEVNTLPGMTVTSLVPQEARAMGMEFPQLCEHLINVSMKKYK